MCWGVMGGPIAFRVGSWSAGVSSSLVSTRVARNVIGVRRRMLSHTSARLEDKLVHQSKSGMLLPPPPHVRRARRIAALDKSRRKVAPRVLKQAGLTDYDPEEPEEQLSRERTEHILLSRVEDPKSAPHPESPGSSKGKVKGQLSRVGVLRPPIQWYPGHIAKAERKLREVLKLVDVVLEVRDCRIPASTTHPSVPEWIGTRRRVVVMNRADLAPSDARSAWKRELKVEQHLSYRALLRHVGGRNGEFAHEVVSANARFVDGKRGTGIAALKKEVLRVGAYVNERRTRKGMLPRPIRCVCIGYPNVGKSALINRLAGRRAVKSENRPGVTRQQQWVRVSKEIELLDTPGIIPMKFVDQATALKLAFCDDIGEASYNVELVAAALLEDLYTVAAQTNQTYFKDGAIRDRFGAFMRVHESGEVLLEKIASSNFQNDLHRAARAILADFRAGRLGPVALEIAPCDIEDYPPLVAIDPADELAGIEFDLKERHIASENELNDGDTTEDDRESVSSRRLLTDSHAHSSSDSHAPREGETHASEFTPADFSSN